jgi:bifunctional DNA-binding transcriptional regulator/antitoxin component of YhaV-PrlF toxin-antitoxin module
MDHVRVSTKYQEVIRKHLRDWLGINPGQQVQVIPYVGRIELISVMLIKDSRGFLAGMNTTVERDVDRVRMSSTLLDGWNTLPAC